MAWLGTAAQETGGHAVRDDRNPPNSLRRNCSKCKANRPALNRRTNKITRLWRCAACLQQEPKK